MQRTTKAGRKLAELMTERSVDRQAFWGGTIRATVGWAIAHGHDTPVTEDAQFAIAVVYEKMLDCGDGRELAGWIRHFDEAMRIARHEKSRRSRRYRRWRTVYKTILRDLPYYKASLNTYRQAPYGVRTF